MEKRVVAYIGWLCVLFAACGRQPIFEVKQGLMVLRVDDRWTIAHCDSVFQQYDLTCLQRDALFEDLNTGPCAQENWRARRRGKHTVEVYKFIEKELHDQDMHRALSWPSADSASLEATLSNGFSNDQPGYNATKKVCFEAVSDSVTRFYLNGFQKAKTVVLAGSFNNWSVSAFRMQSDGDRWYYDVQLPCGRHEYKFIIDGMWYQDTDNLLRTDDHADGYNSVYFKTNTTFRIVGFPLARKVIVAGSFNGWDEASWKMKRNDDAWVLDVFLPDGTYFYKFICDGEWLIDPANTDAVDDGDGNVNSRLTIGTPTRFYLPGYQQANQVALAGSFNEFQNFGVMLRRDGGGWYVDYALRPGNYLFRFIVDGRPVLIDDARYPKSGDCNVLIIGANHTFTFSNKNNTAKAVAVSGDFVQWFPTGIPMHLTPMGYQVDVYVPAGKSRYKFIVDGDWVLDPANPAYEDNEFNTGNSILWKIN